jgi:hypothetical protein
MWMSTTNDNLFIVMHGALYGPPSATIRAYATMRGAFMMGKIPSFQSWQASVAPKQNI